MNHSSCLNSLLLLLLASFSSACSSSPSSQETDEGTVGLDVVMNSDQQPVEDGTASDPGDDMAAHRDERKFRVSVWESCSRTTGECSSYATAGSSFPPGLHSTTGFSLEVGQCRFHRPDPPKFCDPPCEPGMVCRWTDGTCRESIPPLSAGDIVVEGLKSAVTIIPETRYFYYNPHFDPEPANGDLFDEGDLITAHAPGGNVPPFNVETVGVAAVDTELPCPQQLEADMPLVVTWVPGTQGNPVTFEMRSGNHGNMFPSIHCEAADTGELEVDGALIAEYLLDWRPVELWSLSRASAGKTQVEGFSIQLVASTSTNCSYHPD